MSLIKSQFRDPKGQSLLAPWTSTWQHPTTSVTYNLTLTQSATTTPKDLAACFSLIENTSRADYEASTRGWDPAAKKGEMRDPHLRYLIVRDVASSAVCAFASLMPTMEEGQAVVYCYEIHLQPELRGTGLARLLMGYLETVAWGIEVVEKVMLTVFTCNKRAEAFYRRCGFVADECSPGPRKLRGGVVKVPDYAILSKRVAHGEGKMTELNGGSAKRVHGGAVDSRPAKRVKVETVAAVVKGEDDR